MISGIIIIVLLAFSGSIGVSFIISACVTGQPDVWWPLIVILFYIFVPVPTLIAIKMDKKNGSGRIWMDVAIFLTTGIVVMSYATAVLLAKTKTIQWLACILTVIGNTVIYTSVFVYFMTLHSEENLPN